MKNNQNSSLEIEQVILNKKKFDLAEEVLYREVENEAILLHIPTGTYYGLSETSILFWKALQEKQPLKPVVEQIIQEYDVERAQVMQDLQTFLEDLLEAGIIVNSKHT